MPSTVKQYRTFTDEEAASVCAPAEPIAGFPLKYRWHTGPWREIFDEQIRLIKDDITRAKAEGKLLVYLSCPISSRGGGYSGTNVDIARRIERRLLERWGEAFWILNPAQYQLESKAGTGFAGGRYIVEIHVGAHCGANPGLHGRVKWWEIDILQLRIRYIRAVVVTAALRGTVAGKVFHAGQHMIGGADIFTLKSPDLGGGHGGSEVGILSRTLHHPAPARVACNVEHRCKRPVDADGPSFFGCSRLCLSLQRRIPGSSHRDGDRKNSTKTMNDVVAKDQRNMQTRFLDGDMLQAVDHGWIGDEQEGPHLAPGHRLFDWVRRIEDKQLA